MLASVRSDDFSKCRPWKSFMKGVITTPFRKALLRFLDRRYNVFPLHVITPF